MKKIIYPRTHSSDAYVGYLRKIGVEVGEKTAFMEPNINCVDITSPQFISIGNNVCVSGGVRILAHDYSYSVPAYAFGEAYRSQMKTVIGNNVFVGAGSIILMGCAIGDNTIIGAGSVCKGEIQGNSVYAGNPCKKICSLNEYQEKLKLRFEDSLMCYINEFVRVHHYEPDIMDLESFATLFLDETDTKLSEVLRMSVLKDEICRIPRKYTSVDEFLKTRLH